MIRHTILNVRTGKTLCMEYLKKLSVDNSLDPKQFLVDRGISEGIGFESLLGMLRSIRSLL